MCYTLQSGKLVDSAREHVELVGAIGTGDAAATETIMRRHLSHVRGIWADRPEQA